MFNLIRWGVALLALALLAWFVYEVFITGNGAAAALPGPGPTARVAVHPGSA